MPNLDIYSADTKEGDTCYSYLFPFMGKAVPTGNASPAFACKTFIPEGSEGLGGIARLALTIGLGLWLISKVK